MKAVFWILSILVIVSPVSAQEPTGTLRGVIHILSGAPLGGATVYAYDYYDGTNRSKRFQTTADSNGKFVLRNLPPATYSVHAYKVSDGYPDTFFSFFDVGNTKAFQLVEVRAGTTSDLTLELGPKYALLKLSVKDEAGIPVRFGLTFMKGEDWKPIYQTSVGPNGEILVPPVPFRFVIDSDGLQSWESGLLSPEPGEIIPIKVRLKGRASIGTINVMVIDSRGDRVPEASVYLVEVADPRKRITATTDSQGTHVFRDLPPGTYTAHAYKESVGYADTAIPFFTMGEQKWTEMKLSLWGTAAITLRLGPRFPVLTLSIRDEEGSPIAARVSFVRFDDPKHPYSVSVEPTERLLVPPVPFSFEVRAEGFETWRSGPITPSLGETVSVTARLKVKSPN